MSTHDEVVYATRCWLEDVVIGLNLCPFAKAVLVKQQLRLVVCEATATDEIARCLSDELTYLLHTDAQVVDTTLIVVPNALQQFAAYLDFLDLADTIIDGLRLRGTFQIASFHPAYQFADTSPEDVTNFTNRSPYPMLHLLREASVAAAVAPLANPDEIYERNQETMRRLSPEALAKAFPYLRRKSAS